MKKLVENITYNGYVCKFKKKIGRLSFYTYTEVSHLTKGGTVETDWLLIVDEHKNVLAKVSADILGVQNALTFDIQEE